MPELNPAESPEHADARPPDGGGVCEPGRPGPLELTHPLSGVGGTVESMDITRLQPAGLVASPAFSHVAIVPAGATTIYVGGQNGVDDTGAVVSGDVAEQSSRALDNTATALAAAGASLTDVIQWTVLIAQEADLNAAYGAIAPAGSGCRRTTAGHRGPGRRPRRARGADRGERDRGGAAGLSRPVLAGPSSAAARRGPASGACGR